MKNEIKLIGLQMDELQFFVGNANHKICGGIIIVGIKILKNALKIITI